MTSNELEMNPFTRLGLDTAIRTFPGAAQMNNAYQAMMERRRVLHVEEDILRLFGYYYSL